MTKSMMIPKEKRDRIIRELIESVEKGTPDDVLLRKIITQTKYSIHGARGMLQEAKLFAEKTT